MKINRNNYEEFFLLYVDNELTTAEKKSVELFVQENPDLNEELVLLQQSKLLPDDDISYRGKNFLLKPSEVHLINDANYEEFFLLYVDGELNYEQRKEVELFVSKNPKLYIELTRLQQVVLQEDDTVVFEGKEKLLKKDTRRILPMIWVRVASIAAVLLVGIWLFVSRYSPSKMDVNIAKKTITPDVKKDSDVKAQQQPVTFTTDESLHNKSNGNKNLVVQKKNENKERLQGTDKTLNNNKMIQSSDVPSVAPQIANVDTEEKNISKATIHESGVGTTNSVVTAAAPSQISSGNNNDIVVANISSSTTDGVSAVNSTEGPQVGILSFSPRKSKMRGVFRRVTRVFDKTANASDNKNSVLIGSFQIAFK